MNDFHAIADRVETEAAAAASAGNTPMEEPKGNQR
jgi:hypothetical protein